MIMSLLEIALVAVGLSLDVFAAAVCEGAMLAKIEKKKLLIMGLIFCLWQLIAVTAGSAVTLIPVFRSSSGSIRYTWKYMSATIFLALAVYMLVRAFRHRYIFEQRQELNYKNICLLALITSLDAFFAGIGLGFLSADLLLVTVDLLIATIVLAVAGTYTGYRLGYEQRNKAYGIGGIILAAAGMEILIKIVI